MRQLFPIKPVLTVLATLMLACMQSTAQDGDFQLKVDVALVSVDVGVFDRKGEAVTTLRKEDFSVFEDGERQDIQAFESSSVAFNALLVVDRSGSMRNAWEDVVDGLNRFVKVLRAQDRVAIAAFDSDIEMVSNWRSAHTGKQEQIGIFPDGRGTDFYGTVGWAAGYIRAEKGRKGVVVFSDGVQSGGNSDLKKATDRVRQVNVPFYFVGYGTSPESANAMKQLADVSGGRVFLSSSAQELGRIYEQIGKDLGGAYSISYAPKKQPDGQFRKIEVRSLDVRLHVSQSRDGYYAR